MYRISIVSFKFKNVKCTCMLNSVQSYTSGPDGYSMGTAGRGKQETSAITMSTCPCQERLFSPKKVGGSCFGCTAGSRRGLPDRYFFNHFCEMSVRSNFPFSVNAS